MIYIVESLSLTKFIPLVKTKDKQMAKRAQAYIQKLEPDSTIDLVSDSSDRDNVPFAEEYSWE